MLFHTKRIQHRIQAPDDFHLFRGVFRSLGKAGKEGVPSPVDQKRPYPYVSGSKNVFQVHVAHVCSVGYLDAGLLEGTFEDPAIRLFRTFDCRYDGEVKLLQEPKLLQKHNQGRGCVRENPDPNLPGPQTLNGGDHIRIDRPILQ